MLWLTACAVQPVLSDVRIDTSLLKPTGAGEQISISYRIGRNATVSIYVLDSEDNRFDLRVKQPRSADSEPYVLPFDGTVPSTEQYVQRRLLPSGDYIVVVEAFADDGATAAERLSITMIGSTVTLPIIENLVTFPETISPNADAIDDTTEITYQLPVSATVDITLTTPDGQSIPFVSRNKEGPLLQRHIWDGKRPDGALLPNGVYTYTISAEDRFGNIVEQQAQITLEDVGRPLVEITYVDIAPERLMLGGTLTVTLRVKNIGMVPVRTYGPPSGYTYTTDDVFSSIENRRYVSEAGGFWRIGLDWDANSGGGAKRYPFRWALSARSPEQWRVPGKEDWLMPGEEAEIIGHITVLQHETKMGFYVGLIQDGVGFYQDRTGRTIVYVSF